MTSRKLRPEFVLPLQPHFTG